MQGKQEGDGPQGCLSALPAPEQGELGQQKQSRRNASLAPSVAGGGGGSRESDSLILGAVRAGDRAACLGCPLRVFAVYQLSGHLAAGEGGW